MISTIKKTSLVIVLSGSLLCAALARADAPAKPAIADPIRGAAARVTKKPFGIKVSPGHSPVSPERFSGYHTGVDFETTAEEQDRNVPVYALCDGRLLTKRRASGYGGLLVQSCRLEGRAVTVIYGHLKLASVRLNAGAKLAAGQQLGILGKGYSADTDGERKHLHLGIHKGTAINIRGYVPSEAALKDWLDVLELL